MPNVIKHTTGATETGCLKKGNMQIGNNTADYGSTFFNGIDPPSGSYTIYLNKASNGPSIYCPANNTQLIAITNQIAGTNHTTAAQCLNYFAGQSDKLCVNFNYEGIATNGLVLNLDAGFTPSYPTSASTWYDLSGNNINGTLTNGPTFNSANSGSIVFDGVNDFVTLGNSSTLTSNTLTLDCWFKVSTVNTVKYLVMKAADTGFARDYGFVTTVGNKINWFFGNNNPQFVSLTSTVTIGQNVWFNATATRNGSLSVLYINGTANISSSYSFTQSNLGQQLYIGSLIIPNSGRYLQGNASIVRVYNRALSSAEVTQNYNAQKARFGL